MLLIISDDIILPVLITLPFARITSTMPMSVWEHRRKIYGYSKLE